MKEKDKALYDAVTSMLDVVEELARGLAAGQTPEPDWAEIVHTNFDQHRAELREAFTLGVDL